MLKDSFSFPKHNNKFHQISNSIQKADGVTIFQKIRMSEDSMDRRIPILFYNLLFTHNPSFSQLLNSTNLTFLVIVCQ